MSYSRVQNRHRPCNRRSRWNILQKQYDHSFVFTFYFSPQCVHGICVEDVKNQQNICQCETGWKNESCSQCVPYWSCPNQENNACKKPNECICYDGSDEEVCSMNNL